VTKSLFQRGLFILHSGGRSSWKIDCDTLEEEDILTLAEMIETIVPKFGLVEGVPTGGLRLAEKMKFYISEGPLLIIDDVLSTGVSMEEHRAGREAIGAVIFARGKCPSWVIPLFTMT